MVHLGSIFPQLYSIDGFHSGVIKLQSQNSEVLRILIYTRLKINTGNVRFHAQFQHRGPTQSVCVADCYFIVNVLDLPFASPIAIYR